jgi:hypothetical protein
LIHVETIIARRAELRAGPAEPPYSIGVPMRRRDPPKKTETPALWGMMFILRAGC